MNIKRGSFLIDPVTVAAVLRSMTDQDVMEMMDALGGIVDPFEASWYFKEKYGLKGLAEIVKEHGEAALQDLSNTLGKGLRRDVWEGYESKAKKQPRKRTHRHRAPRK